MTKKRRLLSGNEVSELETHTTLEIRTRCPEKYKLVDMETGEEYTGNLPEDTKWHWRKII
jgi:hypothetical protein